MSDEKKEVIPKKEAAPAKEGSVQALARKVDRIIAALEKVFGIDLDRDGKIGSSRIFGAVTAFLLTSCILFAATTIVQYYDGDSTYGTFKVISDDAGTATLTVDAIAADVTGDITGDVTGDLTGAVTYSSTTYTTNATATGTALMILDGSSQAAAVTIAAPTVGERLVIYCVDSTTDCTVTLTSGTWNGSNTIATFADAGDTLEVIGVETNRYLILENIGAVALSGS